MSADPTPIAVHWHDQTRLLGVQVHAFFFDPVEVDARASFVERQLPPCWGQI